MSRTILNAIRMQAFSYVLAQAVVVLCVAGILYFLGKSIAAFSFLWGGMTCVLPNAYLAHKLFAKTGAKASRQIVTSFYLGEMVKFIITIILFAIAFKYFVTDKLILIIGYIVAQITFWFTALIRHRAVNKI